MSSGAESRKWRLLEAFLTRAAGGWLDSWITAVDQTVDG